MRGLYYFPFLSLFYYLGNVECFSTYTKNNNNVVRKTINPSSYLLPRNSRMMQRGLISTTKTTKTNTLKKRTRMFAENFEQQQQQQEQQQIVGDPLVSSSAFALRRSSWFSWWVQMILTIISTVILVFARTILVSSSSPVSATPPQGNFFIARKYLFFPSGLGVLFSYLSILWTWGETRLSSRIVNRQAQQNKNKGNNNTSFISQIGAASITRRAITIGITINCIGLFFTFLGAFQTVGILSAKVSLRSLVFIMFLLFLLRTHTKLNKYHQFCLFLFHSS